MISILPEKKKKIRKEKKKKKKKKNKKARISRGPFPISITTYYQRMIEKGLS